MCLCVTFFQACVVKGRGQGNEGLRGAEGVRGRQKAGVKVGGVGGEIG